MAARKVNSGLVFLKEEQIEEHFKNLQIKERMVIVEPAKVASEETLKENGLLGKELTPGWKPYEYKWRFATEREWAKILNKYLPNRVFKSI